MKSNIRCTDDPVGREVDVRTGVSQLGRRLFMGSGSESRKVKKSVCLIVG